MNIGILGLDTSHAPAFIKYLSANFPSNPVTAAWSGGSDKIPASINRVAQITSEVAAAGIDIVETPEAVAHRSDAVMILSMDASSHLPLLRRIARPNLKIFIDKPLSVTASDAEAISSVASKHSVDVYSASALRFCPCLKTLKLSAANPGRIQVNAPLISHLGIPKYHFYGIHAVEFSFAAHGSNWTSVAKLNNSASCFEIKWKSGNRSLINYSANRASPFSLVDERTDTRIPNLLSTMRPVYGSLVNSIIAHFRGEETAVPLTNSIEIIRVLDSMERLSNSSSRIANNDASA